MNPKELTDDELIKAEFGRRFSLWDIPLEKLDMTLEKMTNEIRQGHYIDLKTILEKPAFKREINDWLRRVSQTLAMGIHNGRELSEVERQGLRICMLEIKNFEDTLTKRSMLLSPTKPLRPISSKI